MIFRVFSFFSFFLLFHSGWFTNGKHSDVSPACPTRVPSLVLAPLSISWVTHWPAGCCPGGQGDKGPLFRSGHDLCSLGLLRIPAIPGFIRLALIRQMKITWGRGTGSSAFSGAPFNKGMGAGQPLGKGTHSWEGGTHMCLREHTSALPKRDPGSYLKKHRVPSLTWKSWSIW